jgi:modification methylase
MRSDWTFALCTGEERLKQKNGKKLHPTQKPEALLARVILASSRPYDVVLDPFCGTGTSCAVAKRLGRRFLGIDREAEYANAARTRLASIQPVPDAAVAAFVTAREAPRVPFASLIERGLVMPGATLSDRKRKVQALVRADGAVSFAGAVGSIHRMGALAQGIDACNGWAFWHLDTPTGLVSIDSLREIVRKDRSPD